MKAFSDSIRVLLGGPCFTRMDPAERGKSTNCSKCSITFPIRQQQPQLCKDGSQIRVAVQCYQWDHHLHDETPYPYWAYAHWLLKRGFALCPTTVIRFQTILPRRSRSCLVAVEAR